MQQRNENFINWRMYSYIFFSDRDLNHIFAQVNWSEYFPRDGKLMYFQSNNRLSDICRSYDIVYNMNKVEF